MVKRAGCKEFILFPKLPTELRILVWRFALENEAPDRLLFTFDNKGHHLLPQARLISPLLLTSTESRFVARKFYTDILEVWKDQGFNKRTGLFQRVCQGRLYLNLSSDTMVIGSLVMKFCSDYSTSMHKPTTRFVDGIRNFVKKAFFLHEERSRVRKVLYAHYFPWDGRYSRTRGGGEWPSKEEISEVAHSHCHALFPNVETCRHVHIDTDVYSISLEEWLRKHGDQSIVFGKQKEVEESIEQAE